MSVASAETQATFCATLFDEFARAGLEHAVVCPGSRSTPLALAAAQSVLEVHVRLDERSAGFYALGLARATGRPVPIIVTSGTAVAELSAAVIEASLDRVPLIVLSADRPIELHHRGAAQTINQAGLFERHAVFSIDVQAPAAMDRSQWRGLASRLVIESAGVSGMAGTAHLNLGLIEPLAKPPGILPEGRSDGGPWLRSTRFGPQLTTLNELLPRRVVVLGAGASDHGGLENFVAISPMPILADPRSGARRYQGASLVTSADAIARSARALADLRPDQIIVVGAPPASKELAQWIDACTSQGSTLVSMGPDGPSRFPSTSSVDHRLVPSVDDAIAVLASSAVPVDAAFAHAWADAEQRAQRAMDDSVIRFEWSEPSVARQVAKSLRGDEILVTSSSMPIRDLEFFGGPCEATTIANRGANGIDGVVSTALGIAATGAAVTCLIGDLAFLYDVSSLVDGIGHDERVRIVVLDNQGGGIFSFLPQHQSVAKETFEQLFGTPPRVDPAQVAQGFGLAVTQISGIREFRALLSAPITGLEVIVCRLPGRDENVAVHAEINRSIVESLG